MRGTVVFKQGEIPNEILFITKGQIALRYSWKLRENKGKIPLQFSEKVKKTETFVLLCRGEMIGEEALFKSKQLCYEVVCDTECEFYCIEIEKLRTLCQGSKFIKEIMIDKIENKIEMIARRMKPFFQYMREGNTGIPPDMMKAAEEEERKKEDESEETLPEINYLEGKSGRFSVGKNLPFLFKRLLSIINLFLPILIVLSQLKILEI